MVSNEDRVIYTHNRAGNWPWRAECDGIVGRGFSRSEALADLMFRSGARQNAKVAGMFDVLEPEEEPMPQGW